MQRLFQYLVAISTVLFVILWLLPLADSVWLSEAERGLLQARGYKSVIPYHPIFHWGLFTVWLLLSIGLFFFNQGARAAYSILVVLTTIANLLWGYAVVPPVEVAIGSIVTMADGAILAIAYLTSVDKRFRGDY